MPSRPSTVLKPLKNTQATILYDILPRNEPVITSDPDTSNPSPEPVDIDNFFTKSNAFFTRNNKNNNCNNRKRQQSTKPQQQLLHEHYRNTVPNANDACD